MNSEDLLKYLDQSVGPDAALRQAAEVVLLQSESTPEKEKFLFVIYIKHLLQKYWRSEVADDEKEAFRRFCVLLLKENNPQIAKQAAWVVGYTYLIDEEKYWDENSKRLQNAISNESASIGERLRGMQAYYQLLKQLHNNESSRIFSREHFTTIFHTTCSVIADQLANVSIVVNAVAAFSKGEVGAERLQELVPVSELCRFAFKQLRSVVTHALTLGLKDDILGQFLAKTLENMRLFVMCRLAVPVEHPLSGALNKYLVTCAKMVVEAQDEQPILFVPLLFPYLEFFCGCITQTSSALFERFIIYCIVFLRGVIECYSYRDRQDLALSQQIETFFSQPLVAQLAQRALFEFMRLSQEDLARWEHNPEEFFIEDVRCPWLERLRPCAELFFGTLLRNFPSPVAPVLAQAFNRALGAEDAAVNREEWILAMEALYGAIGHDPNQLSKFISLGDVMPAVRLHLSNPHPAYRLLRRRIASVLEAWGPRETTILKEVYGSIIRLMADPDLVVRLFALVSLKSNIFVDDPRFVLAEFREFIEPAIALLIRAERETGESDTYVQLLFVLAVLIKHLGREILPFAPKIVEGLQLLWNVAEAHYMTKGAILQALKPLVESLGPQSNQLWGFLLPLIRLATDPSQKDATHIIEDGLSLWYQTLLRAPLLAPELLSLFPAIPAILAREKSPAVAKHVARLLEGYIVLGKAPFMLQNMTVIVGVIEKLVADGNSLLVVASMLFTLVQLFPNDVLSFLEPVLERLLFRVLIFNSVDAGAVLTYYLSLFARLLLHNSQAFFTLIQKAQTHPMNSSQQPIFLNLLDIWMQKLEKMEEAKLQKLNVMALSTLLANAEIGTERTNRLMELAVEVQKNARGQPLPDSPARAAEHFAPKEGMGQLERELLQKRGVICLCHLLTKRPQLQRDDPVFNTDIQSFVLRHARANAFLSSFTPMLEQLQQMKINKS